MLCYLCYLDLQLETQVDIDNLYQLSQELTEFDYLPLIILS